MSTFHLQARRTTRPGTQPRRDETHLSDSDDLETLAAEANMLAADGFTVWIFRRMPRPPHSTALHQLELVTTIPPIAEATRTLRQNGGPVPGPPRRKPSRDDGTGAPAC
jgi:hypothetical protein